MRIGPLEAALILLIVFIVFGAGKLPQLGGALGKGIRNFRKGMSGEGGKEEPPKSEAVK